MYITLKLKIGNNILREENIILKDFDCILDKQQLKK